MGRYVYPAGHERTFGGIAIGKAASESTAFFEIIVPLRLRIMQIYFTSFPFYHFIGYGKNVIINISTITCIINFSLILPFHF